MNRLRIGLILSLIIHFALIFGFGAGRSRTALLKGHAVATSAPTSRTLMLTSVGSQSAKKKSKRTHHVARVEKAGHGDRLTTRSAAPSRDTLAEFDTEDYGFEEGNDTVRERYLQRLVEFFESRKTYPEGARASKQNGRVEVGFVLARDGSITNVKLLTLSPHPALNRAALALVREAKRFRPIPRELGIDTWKLMLPIEYQLAAGIR